MRIMTAAAPQRRSLIHVVNSAFAINIGIGWRSSPGSNRAQACMARRVPGKLSRGRSKGNALGPHCATDRATDWGAPVRHNSCRYSTMAMSKARGSPARSDADGRPVAARNASKPTLATPRVEMVLGRTPPSMRRTFQVHFHVAFQLIHIAKTSQIVYESLKSACVFMVKRS